jgi:hypothetical protein
MVARSLALLCVLTRRNMACVVGREVENERREEGIRYKEKKKV